MLSTTTTAWRALLLLSAVCLTPLTFAAFTMPITSGNDTIERNELGTWCFYPAANASTSPLELDASCRANDNGGNPEKADFEAVMQAHLTQRPADSLAVAYYSAAGVRLGGAGHVVAQERGKVYLCVSGRRDVQGGGGGEGEEAERETYVTMCELADGDNSFGLWDARGQRKEGKTVCAVGVGQRNVSDGCYLPVGMSLLDEEPSGAVSGVGLLSYSPLVLASIPLLSTLLWASA